MRPIKTCAAVAALLFGTYPSQAITGAELLTQPASYVRAYVFGAVDALLNVGTPDQVEIINARRKCLTDAKMTDAALQELTLQYIRNHPDAAVLPAAVSVLKLIGEMCDKGQ